MTQIDKEFVRMHDALWKVKGNRCAYCGNPATCLHHIIPRHMGGDNRLDNIIPLCEDCHLKAHSKHRSKDKWKSKGRPKREKPLDADAVFEEYISVGMPLKIALERLGGIGKTTFYKWLDEFKNGNEYEDASEEDASEPIYVRTDWAGTKGKERLLLENEAKAFDRYLKNPNKRNRDAYRKASDAVETMLLRQI